jgi:hypothetical protein
MVYSNVPSNFYVCAEEISREQGSRDNVRQTADFLLFMQITISTNINTYHVTIMIVILWFL